MTKPELFQAKAYAKHWPSWKIWFLLTCVSVHGNAHQPKRQVIDIQKAAYALSPHHLTALLYHFFVGRLFFGRWHILCTSASVYEEMTVFYSICTTTD